jgi:glycosyltransferase involved in cell wall biosynthesis
MVPQEISPPIQVLIAHYLPDIVSGAERSIADFVEKTDRTLMKCIMLTPGEGALADFYRTRGLNVWAEHIETPRRKYPGLHLVQSTLAALRFKRRGVDIVLSNTFSAGSRIATAARLAGVPNAIFIREFISDKPAHRKILNQADRVFVISQDLQSYIQAMTDPGKVTLTYNYIDPGPILEKARLHSAHEERALPFGREVPVVGLIGRITRFKQQDLLIRAAPKILEKVPEARFVIVGSARDSEKEYEDFLHRLTCDLGVEERVVFLGQRKDTIEITTELTVSCLTSDREPLGRVILEANLLGCPVVASNTGGPSEIIEDGRTGLLFPATASDASDQLAKQIVRLLKDPNLRKKLAQAGKEKMEVTFASMEHVHRQEACILGLCYSRSIQKQIKRF